MASINDVLTDREVEVLRLAASGRKDWQVAEELKVSTSTITTYWYRIKMKLSVRTRSEAIALYATLRIAPSEQWSESGDTVSHKASSRQWSELGAPFVTFVIDHDGKFRQGSGSVTKYVGTSGKPPSDEQWNRFIQQTIGPAGLRELRETGRYSARAKIGALSFDVFALVSNAHASKNNVTVVTAIDVTSHIKLQTELFEERGYFKSVLDQAPNMYFIWDFQLGAITYVNHFAHHVLGFTPDQLKSLGWSVFDLIHPDDRDEAMARISQISHMRKGDIQSMPLRVKTLEGKFVSFNTISTPFSINEDDSVKEFLCACFDIGSYHDQLDKLEQEYQILSDRFDSLMVAVKNASIGLMTIDTEGRVLSINVEGLRMISANRDGWQDFYDFNSTTQPDRTPLQLSQDWIKASAPSANPMDIQAVVAKDYLGQMCKYMAYVSPIRDAQGNIRRYAITFNDLSTLEYMHKLVSALIENEASQPEP